MRLDIKRYEGVNRSLGRHLWGFSIAGWISVLSASFWALIALFAIFNPTNPEDVPMGIALLVIGVGFPGFLAATFFFLARGARKKRKRFETLAVLARRGSPLDAASVAQDLALDSATSERFLLLALTRGVLVEEGPSPDQQELAPPRAPSPGAGWPATTGGGTSPASRPSATSLVGLVLNGTYEVERLLGEGGMSEVYAARHLRTGKRHAIKALLPGSRFSEEAIRRFRREAAAASALGHPGIVEIHDFDVTADGTHFIVTELLEGETLEERLGREGARPWVEVSRTALEVAGALGAAHEAGILHRDLKPSNVFLARGGDGRERAVLLDFGIAKPIDDAAVSRITTTGAVIGTPLYMSPEQARSEPLDVRSDVYGLGCLLYEMVTGRPPFVEPTMASLYARLLNDPPPLASSVSPGPIPEGVDELLGCALAKGRTERFGSAAAFAEALREIDRMETARSGVRVGRTA